MKRISYENLESEGYLLKEDAKSIEAYAGKHSVMVSFRNAGSATLNQLKKGAAAKGHDILDKTIKSKTLGLKTDAGLADLNTALLSAMEADASTASILDAWSLLGGFVASWKAPCQLSIKCWKIIRTHFRAFFTLATMICMTWP